MPLPTVGRKGLPAAACQTSMSFESMDFQGCRQLLDWLADQGGCCVRMGLGASGCEAPDNAVVELWKLAGTKSKLVGIAGT